MGAGVNPIPDSGGFRDGGQNMREARAAGKGYWGWGSSLNLNPS